MIFAVAALHLVSPQTVQKIVQFYKSLPLLAVIISPEI